MGRKPRGGESPPSDTMTTSVLIRGEYKVVVVCTYGIVDRVAHVPAINNLELRPVHGQAARPAIPVDGGETDLEVFSFL